MRVLALDRGRGLALCANGEGARETVQTDLVGPIDVGTTLLVHAGVALQRLDAEAAA
jgi:hydrogenase maturation factor